MPETNETYQPMTFDAIRIGLASSEKRFWNGPMVRLETGDHQLQNLKAGKDGLYCENLWAQQGLGVSLW